MDEDAGESGGLERKAGEAEEHRSKDWIAEKAQFLMWRKHSPSSGRKHKMSGGTGKEEPIQATSHARI